MHILLDNIIFSLQQSGGISVYWSELLRGFLETKQDFTCIERKEASNNLHRKSLAIPQHHLRADSQYPLALSRYLPVYTNGFSRNNLFHSSYYRTLFARGVTNVTTVFDFTYELHSQGIKRFIHSTQKQLALANAAMIICISENTRNDLFKIYPDIKPERVRVIPLAAAKCFRPISSGIQWDERSNIIFVGARTTYKNFPLAVETVAQLSRKKLLVIGGGDLSATEHNLLERILPNRYEHLPGLDCESLNRLYNEAFCLLYPSTYEGFGIPPLEAMQAGCPVIAMGTSSLPEVCGDAALLAHDQTLECFTSLLVRLAEESIWDRHQKLGFFQASKFSWERVCNETLGCYHEAIGMMR